MCVGVVFVVMVVVVLVVVVVVVVMLMVCLTKSFSKAAYLSLAEKIAKESDILKI
jgi:uncharacterized membrane protein